MGANEVVLRALSSLNREKDIVVVRPFYGPLFEACRNSKAIREVNLEESNDFAITSKAVIATIEASAGNVSCLYLANPNNPTGKLIDPRELEAIINYCEAKGIFVVIDEVSKCFMKEEELAACHPANIDSSFVIRTNSLSKSHTLAGSDLGWLTTKNRDILGAVHRLVSIGSGSPATSHNPEFKALVNFRRIRALSGADRKRELLALPQHIKAQYDSYITDMERNEQFVIGERNRVVEILQSHPGVEKVVVPDALYNVIVKFRCTANSFQVFQELLKAGVVILPGGCMGLNPEECWARLTIVNRPDQNNEGLKAIFKFLEDRAQEFLFPKAA